MASLHLSQEIFKLIYPVGSIYLSTSTTNPSTYFGGTWEQVAKEKYLIGYNASNTWFDKPGTSTGSNGNSGNWNANNHTLTINEIPSHSHTVMSNIVHSDGTVMNNSEILNTGIFLGSGRRRFVSYCESQGGGQGHNHFHVSPFYVVVVWKRTA